MKLLSPFLFLLFCAVTGKAQVTSLNENFDVSCATTGTHYPSQWSEYNVIPPTTALAWTCEPLGGRFSTPGIVCNSYFLGIHYLDTAWLFTPVLNLGGNTDHIYLRYDSKYVFSASKLHILVSHNYIAYTSPDTAGVDWYDITSTIAPVISNSDSTDWVTHFIDLTPFKNSPMMVAFRYTSTTASGGTWALDNIMTTPWGLHVGNLDRELVPLTIIGNSTPANINISFTSTAAASYKLSIFDNLGREVHIENITAHSGTQNYSINELQLHAGIYCVKLSNGTTYGVAKTVVE